MHWHARLPRHRRLPHYLRASMLIDAERDDAELLRAEDEAIAARDAVETPSERFADLMEILSDGREPQGVDEAPSRTEG